MNRRVRGQSRAQRRDLLGNVITGRAATYLSAAGFPSNLAPPTLVIGRGTMLSTLDIRRLVIPFETEFGLVDVNVALKEDGNSDRSA